MRTGRKPHADPPAEWKIFLPLSLASQIDLLLLDPMRNKVKYGARGQLVEKLLRDWLRLQQAEGRK